MLETKVMKFSPTERAVYRHNELDRLFNPRSVAIVGASPKAASFGARTLQNLGNFNGDIYLVNEKYQEISGRPCYASLNAIGSVPDCAILALPRDGVEAVVEECIEQGVGGVIIYASGFAEGGQPEYVDLQRRLVEMTRNTQTRILGPNCIGVINTLTGMHGVFVTATTKFPHLGGCRIGLISQSGALGLGLAQAAERGVSFSHVFTLGNSCDVDVADEIAYLAEDRNCDVIACVFEGTDNPTRLIEAGRLAKASKKAVVVFKLATGESGAQAAMSHTGSLAGAATSYEAVFERAGFILVREFEDLLETAAFFGKAPPLKATGVAVLTPSGGAGILAADQAELHGVSLPQPGKELEKLLKSHIPEFGSPRNPCDVTAQILNNPDSFPACAQGFLNQKNIGALAIPNGNAHASTAERIRVIGDLARASGKVVCAYWLAGWQEGPGSFELEIDPNVAVFRSTARCFSALAAWHEWSAKLTDETLSTRSSPESAASQVQDMVTHAADGSTLSESQSKAVLAAYKIPVVQDHIVHNKEQAAATAEALGYPVVLKVESPDLPHKTEAGVVRLSLLNRAAVEAAYDEIMENAAKVRPIPKINGVLVQPLVSAGLEMMVGAKVDGLFGPLVIVSLGGVKVELLKDLRSTLRPLRRNKREEYLRQC